MIKKRINALIEQKKSFLCVGLDPDVQKIPTFFLRMQDPITEFTKSIVNATSDVAIAYKMNFAFYEALGLKGLHALDALIHNLPKHVVTIADAKRADIGNTSRLYATAFFETWGFDAVTVPPYMGYDSIEPFLSYKEKLTLILCLTSNNGAQDFEEKRLENGKRLYEAVLEKALEWNQFENVGLVVGANRAEELKRLRAMAQGVCFLIPGVGVQGGTIEDSVRYGADANAQSALINIGRAVIYPDGEFSSVNDFEKAVAKKAEEYVAMMRNALEQSAV
ncbi:MAG: orotidine-5'-phosphate decarboxylase [Candidatus Thermochlorobacter aerophilum]|jgi:orotidine-5'-phosphate decarboxylase|uniref:Orotidine-5'-phosphate decarboxylase n=1 Tax=Candidatus Thermochlorobacter aerophilus TaxID=1868324 RepID=A0A395M2M7_9BACT|nr:MAG: orotidine-5'-phosphate decarboxylase [Candidatus Thermochlorobacter aerophilum]